MFEDTVGLVVVQQLKLLSFASSKKKLEMERAGMDQHSIIDSRFISNCWYTDDITV